MTNEQQEKEIENTIRDIATMGFLKLALSPADVAQILDVDISTLYNWRCKAVGPQFGKSGKGKKSKVIYTPRSIAVFLFDQRQKTA